jgi:HSP20 family protein
MTQGWFMSELDGLLRLQNELDRVLEQPYGWFESSTFGRGAFPPVNIFRGDDGYVIRVELPGLPPEDLNLETKGDTLVITGKRSTESLQGNPHRVERWNGEFRRVVQLPQDAELSKADASYRHGVLSVTVPHREEAKPRRISVQS